jgi:transcriptional regulator with XRE-family HTH domain
MASGDAGFVREAREILGFTQVQLADILGVSERLISMWENEERDLPLGRRRHIELLLRAKRKR